MPNIYNPPPPSYGVGGGYSGGLGPPVLSGPNKPVPAYGDPGTFGAAVNTQAADYDRIMQGYQNLPPIQYQQSADVTGSLANLSDLATTGGYSQQGIQDLRARGISPIRSVYANAKQDIDRARTLGGGYSPSYNAVTARMTRELSDKIAEATQNVNAGIAQNVAQNRLSAAPQYASAADTAQGRELNTQQLNAELRLAALQGQSGLYGTTPALVKTFGDQTAQATGLGQNQQEINNKKLGSVLGGMQIFT